MNGVNNWVIAHRGVWEDPSEKNSQQALEKAFEYGMGVETDFRDFQGDLVLSHDIFVEDNFIPFAGFNLTRRYAINLKADGLLELISPNIEEIKSSGSFVFDGSIPEMVRYRDSGIPHALRLSEYETELPWRSDYLWIDCFESDWWRSDTKINALFETHHLVFVSPELHRRDHRSAFETFVKFRRQFGENFSVCTDFPSELLELANE